MFRRKEESLFDTDSAAPARPEAVESATVINPPAAPQTATASSYTPAAPTQPAAPRAQAPQQPASGFRATSSAPIGGELTRGRLPETKSTIPGVSSMGAEKTGKAARRVLTVGNDILLKGEIATCDRLVIEGKVDATLNDVHTVEIAESGAFKGSAHIEDAEISGLFEGDLVVRNRLVIYATGKVRGKITYGEIEIERGGELTGEIKTSSQSAASASTSRATKKEAVAA